MSSLKEILNRSVDASFDFIEKLQNNDLKIFISFEENPSDLFAKIIIDVKGNNLVSVDFVIRSWEDCLKYMNFLEALNTVIIS